MFNSYGIGKTKKVFLEAVVTSRQRILKMRQEVGAGVSIMKTSDSIWVTIIWLSQEIFKCKIFGYKAPWVKYWNFAKFPGMEILQKCTVSTEIQTIRPKLCENCAFPQIFHIRKLVEITVFMQWQGSTVCISVSIVYIMSLQAFDKHLWKLTVNAETISIRSIDAYEDFPLLTILS